MASLKEIIDELIVNLGKEPWHDFIDLGPNELVRHVAEDVLDATIGLDYPPEVLNPTTHDYHGIVITIKEFRYQFPRLFQLISLFQLIKLIYYVIEAKFIS